MQLTSELQLAFPVETVWAGFSDLRLVAECLPGASIVEELPDGRYRGKFTVKLGPLAASFGGELAIERQETEKVAVVKGKGTDAKSSTRANATMTYRLAPNAGGTRVEIVTDIQLAGALAQFSKAAVMEEVAAHLTAEFAHNFTQRLRAATLTSGAVPASAAQEPTPAAELNGLSLMLKIIWRRIRMLFGFRKKN